MNKHHATDPVIEGVGDGDVSEVHLPRLPPLTTLLVSTRNSSYRVIVMEGSNVYVQGGHWCANPTAASVNGAQIGGNLLKLGWIAVGFRMDIQVGGRRIVTSPVRAITAQRQGISTVH